jgi:ribosomal protection tetracycline resistance protein
MSSTSGDFRGLTPLVLTAALRQAGTRVHEPVHRFRLDLPADALGAVLPALGRLRAVPGPPAAAAASGRHVLEGDIPAAAVHALERQLPTLTRGEGVLETSFGHYAPVSGRIPVRRRTGPDPGDRREYLLAVRRRLGTVPHRAPAGGA